MNWDDLLDRIRQAGSEPVEELFMDNYGTILKKEHPELRGRNFRCTFGLATVEGFRFEAYTFASSGDAADFLEVIDDGSGWYGVSNMVFHDPKSDRTEMEHLLNLLKT